MVLNNMNMRVLKKSKVPPLVGDIFAYQMTASPDRYFFGRVIRTDAVIGGFKNTILVYFYKRSSRDKAFIPDLICTELLIAPIATNALPWLKGYFELVRKSALEDMDILPNHCFRDFRGKFFDSDGLPLTKPVEPIGEYGLHSYRTIDDALSKAMGIALSID